MGRKLPESRVIFVSGRGKMYLRDGNLKRGQIMSKESDPLEYPIFVYGTLRPGGTQYMIVRPFVDSVRSATIQGYQMYRFGRFPGLVKRPQQAFPVKGELLYIKSAMGGECLSRLDKYESVGWLFDRVIEYAQTDHLAEPIPCWIYVVREQNLSVEEAGIIPRNDWYTANRG